MHKVGCIGAGFVGTAVELGLESVAEIRIYDKYKDTESLYSVVNNSDVIFICVPTPMDSEGYCDTSIVEEVCCEVSSNATSRKSIVIKSTVPPGTTQGISKYLQGKHGLMFNPEFLTEKNFLNDFLEQDRIFIGPADECAEEDVSKVTALYESFVATQKTPASINKLDTAATAELLKYATNSFLATKVMFFNEIYDISNAVGVDFNSLTAAMKMDERIGKSHMAVPGPDGLRGFGSKCLPKDISALIELAGDFDLNPMVLDTVWSKNLLIREKYDWEDIKGATTDCAFGDE